MFGAPTPAPTGPAGQPFGFTGREHELDSGLVYARQRYLSPETGRWINPDPLGDVDGPNVFAYVRNRPVTALDPYGLFSFDWRTWQIDNSAQVRDDLLAFAYSQVGQVLKSPRGLRSCVGFQNLGTPGA